MHATLELTQPAPRLLRRGSQEGERGINSMANHCSGCEEEAHTVRKSNRDVDGGSLFCALLLQKSAVRGDPARGIPPRVHLQACRFHVCQVHACPYPA